jgi:hypothetical protein
MTASCSIGTKSYKRHIIQANYIFHQDLGPSNKQFAALVTLTAFTCNKCSIGHKVIPFPLHFSGMSKSIQFPFSGQWMAPLFWQFPEVLQSYVSKLLWSSRCYINSNKEDKLEIKFPHLSPPSIFCRQSCSVVSFSVLFTLFNLVPATMFWKMNLDKIPLQAERCCININKEVSVINPCLGILQRSNKCTKYLLLQDQPTIDLCSLHPASAEGLLSWTVLHILIFNFGINKLYL